MFESVAGPSREPLPFPSSPTSSEDEDSESDDDPNIENPEVNCSVAFKAQFQLRFDQPVDPEHKDSLCKIAAIAAGCHVETKADTRWEDFSTLLAYEIYSAVKDKEYKRRDTLAVQINKRANNVVLTGPQRIIYQDVKAQVQVKIETKNYQVYYRVHLGFYPSGIRNTERENEDIPEEKLILSPPYYFFEILQGLHKRRSQYASVFSINAQVMVNMIAQICQPVMTTEIDPEDQKKVTIKLSVTIKSLTDYVILPEDKDLVAQRVALIAGMHLENKIQSQWTDLSYHSAWELFLKLRYLDYAPKMPRFVQLHLEADNVNAEGLLRSVASHLYAGFTIKTKHGSYELFYRIKYGYYPNAIPKAEDIPLDRGVVLTRVFDPPAPFRDVVNAIERLRPLYTSGYNIMIKELSKVVNAKCPNLITY